jgi:peroxiredoxin
VKEEFSELQGRGDDSALWHWVYTVDSVKLNQPPPEWLVAESTIRRDHPRPEWVGRDAPDFSLLDLDGRQVKLSAMRGKVVVLDFWATWCGPCKEELPILEKIRDEYKAKAVEFWGISDEEPSKVKYWMARNKTNLSTVIDPETKTSDQYRVDGIPALIVIGRDGKILSYYTGPQTEQSLRSAIDLALNESPTTDK